MKLPSRDDIVKEALEKINPAADKKAACERQIRTYFSLLDVLQKHKAERRPSPAEIKRNMGRLTKALKKIEAILQSPACDLFRRMPAYLDYDRFMADLKKVRETADYQVRHSKTPRRAKSFGLLKWYAGKYAVKLVDEFGRKRPSKARLASTLLYGATGDHDADFEYLISVVHK